MILSDLALSLMKRPAAAMERAETRVACLGDSNTVGGGLGRLNSNEFCEVGVLSVLFHLPSPSLKLTATACPAPENRGPLESRRFRTWKPPFLEATYVSFRECRFF